MGEKLLLYLNIAIAVTSLFATIFILIKSLIKAKTHKERVQAVEDALEIGTKITDILRKIPSIITQSEDIFGDGNGSRKKFFAMKEIENECLKLNVNYDEYKNEFDAVIESILSTPRKKSNQGE